MVTLVGYTEPYAYSLGADYEIDHDWRSRGPFFAYLRPGNPTRGSVSPNGINPYLLPTDMKVGQLALEEHTGPYRDGALRATATFVLPEGIATGPYQAVVCNDPCTTGLGWFSDSLLYVGVDPPDRIVRDWPLDDPAIAGLDDDALLYDPAGGDGDTIDDWAVTAAEVRAGYRPTPPPVVAVEAPAPPPTTTLEAAASPSSESKPDPAQRSPVDAGSGLSGEVIAWLVGLGVLLGIWCAAWRLRPGGGRIVVRQTDDPHRPPLDAADDREPVRIEL